MKKPAGTRAKALATIEVAPQLIPLNLIYDYPVRWSKFKVLRDLVQNFYDQSHRSATSGSICVGAPRRNSASEQGHAYQDGRHRHAGQKQARQPARHYISAELRRVLYQAQQHPPEILPESSQ